jgi:integrase
VGDSCAAHEVGQGTPGATVAPAAVALLERMKPAQGKSSGLVFCNPDGAACSDMALLSLIKRMDGRSVRAGGKGWKDERGERITPHGFRSSFRDWCGDDGKPRDLAEAALSHADGSATERAQARSDLLDRRCRHVATDLKRANHDQRPFLPAAFEGVARM